MEHILHLTHLCIDAHSSRESESEWRWGCEGCWEPCCERPASVPAVLALPCSCLGRAAASSPICKHSFQLTDVNPAHTSSKCEGAASNQTCIWMTYRMVTLRFSFSQLFLCAKDSRGNGESQSDKLSKALNCHMLRRAKTLPQVCRATASDRSSLPRLSPAWEEV